MSLLFLLHAYMLCSQGWSTPIQAPQYIHDYVAFTSDAPLETIASKCTKIVSDFNPKTGSLNIQVPVVQFEFDRPLMKKHFTENYLETHLYPNATFEGFIIDITQIDFNKPGQYKVNGIGTMNIHGVSQDIRAVGFITVKSPDEALLNVSHDILLSDFNVDVPLFAKGNIAEKIKIDISVALTKAAAFKK